MPFRTHTGVTNSAQYSMPEKLCFIDCPSDKEMCESRACRPRPLSSSDLIGRRESEDLHSGVGSPLLVARRSPGISIAMKRSGSDSLQSRPRSEDGNTFSISEQTQLLLRKMLVLEKKVSSMETQLKEEQLQRLHLEAKVVKLEEENQDLKQNRGHASKQLQDFADRFYAATENLSPSPPHPSISEIRMRGSRTPSRRDSVSSAGSIFSRDSVGSRYSGISIN